MTTRREIILANTSDLASYFLYYDRKGDEDLPVGEIAAGEITKAEIVQTFSEALKLDEATVQASTRFIAGDRVRYTAGEPGRLVVAEVHDHRSEGLGICYAVRDIDDAPDAPLVNVDEEQIEARDQ